MIKLNNKKVVSNTCKKTREEHVEDALYREVWEDVNNEKTQQFLQKYWRIFVGMTLIVLVVVIGIQIGIRTHQNKQNAIAISYETAVASLNPQALATLAKNNTGATADIASFQAFVLDKDVSHLEYLVKYGQVPDFKDLARIHIVNLQGDKMTAEELEQYLEPLNSKTSPFYFLSRLIIAQKYLSVNDRQSANKWLDIIINDNDAPAMIVANAQTLR